MAQWWRIHLPGDAEDTGSNSGSGRSPGGGNGNPFGFPVFLPGKSHEQRSLVGYSPWGHKEMDMTEQLSKSLDSTRVDRWAFLVEIEHNHCTSNCEDEVYKQLWTKPIKSLSFNRL